MRNGSISTVVSPSVSSKAEWPRKRISIVVLLLCRRFSVRHHHRSVSGSGEAIDRGSQAAARARTSLSLGGVQAVHAEAQQQPDHRARHARQPARLRTRVGQREQQRGDRRDAEQIALVVVAARARRSGRGPPRRPAGRARRRCRRSRAARRRPRSPPAPRSPPPRRTRRARPPARGGAPAASRRSRPRAA